MNVSEAVRTRKSIRAFLDRPVDEGVLREVLTAAARAPSGGNLQSWRLFVLTGASLSEFRGRMRQRLREAPLGEPVEYDIYPPNLHEPYRSERFKVGEQMYALLGAPREDKAGRLRQFANNYRFFGAPVALFFAIDRQMGIDQWADLGMFMQSVMLMARKPSSTISS